MNIGQVAKAIGVSTSAIRYYEEMGLIRSNRTEAGYRQFSAEQVRLLGIIIQAKDLGFSLKEIKEFALSLQAGNMTKQKVRKNLEAKVLQLEDRVKAIRRFQKNIRVLMSSACPNALPDGSWKA